MRVALNADSGGTGGRMELKHIELLEILTRTRSLSRAAVELGTSQPRLTQQLQLVEKELGVSLFHRSAAWTDPV